MRYSISKIHEKEYFPGFHGRVINGKSMTLAFWDVKKEAIVPLHNHHQEQHLLCMEGTFELVVGEEKYKLLPGDVVVILPNVPHSGIALTDCKLIDVFSPLRIAFGQDE